MSRHDFIVRSFLYSRGRAIPFFLGDFSGADLRKSCSLGMILGFVGGCHQMSPFHYRVWEESWQRSRALTCCAITVRGWGVLWGGRGGCGGGAMVVIACSTCLNSSHIHLGPSFTLDCFYKGARAPECFSKCFLLEILAQEFTQKCPQCLRRQC